MLAKEYLKVGKTSSSNEVLLSNKGFVYEIAKFNGMIIEEAHYKLRGVKQIAINAVKQMD